MTELEKCYREGEYVIEVQRLTKVFGRNTVVDSASFCVRPGVITGFLGPNGAGKTTTLRVILGLSRPTTGFATVNGREYVQHRSPLKEVGALLDANSIHGSLSPRSYLHSIALTHGISRDRVREVVLMVGLESVLTKRVKTFSLGMRQRLGIAAAMLGDPQTLIFDEPTNGLDPDGSIWFRGLLRHLAGEGKTVFLSSHLMSEMAQTVEHIVVLGRGKILADASLESILQADSEAKVRVSSPRLIALLEKLTRVATSIKMQGLYTAEVGGIPATEISELASSTGIVLEELVVIRPSLEDSYLRLTDRDSDYRADSTMSGLVQ